LAGVLDLTQTDQRRTAKHPKYTATPVLGDPTGQSRTDGQTKTRLRRTPQDLKQGAESAPQFPLKEADRCHAVADGKRTSLETLAALNERGLKVMSINEEMTHEKLKNAMQAVNDAMALSPHEPVHNRMAAVIGQTVDLLEATEKAQAKEMHRLALRLVQTRFALQEVKRFLAGLEAFNEETLRPIIESVLADVRGAASITSSNLLSDAAPSDFGDDTGEAAPHSPIELMSYRR
jgi:hypothetical protein